MKKKVIIFSVITLYCVGLIIALVYHFVKKAETEAAVEKIRFDLSQYEDHGRLSCGLVWVTKEFSDWDEEPIMKFAYLDADGYVKSSWFSLDEYRTPRDFSNGYVIITTFEVTEDHSNCVVYNTQFQRIASLNCKISPHEEPCISNFDNQGYSYAVGYDLNTDEEMLYWIDSSGLHEFQKNDRYSFGAIDERKLNEFKVSNNHFVIVSGSNDPNYLYTIIAHIYDSNGKLMLDIEEAMSKHSEDFAITSAEVLDNNTVKFYFYGTNKKRYVCTMNFSGDFVQSPEET